MGYLENFLEELETNFGEHTVPQSLKELIDFENSIGEDDRYTDNFDFRLDDNLECMLDANDISDDDIETITQSLVEFASADDTGGIFVFWLKEGLEPEEFPIIWFGSEGEMGIIASNFKEFITLLTTGIFPLYINEEEPCDYVTQLPKFRTWVKEHLNLKIIEKQEDIDELNQKAVSKFQQSLFDWLRLNGAEIYTLPEDAIWNDEENRWDY